MVGRNYLIIKKIFYYFKKIIKKILINNFLSFILLIWSINSQIILDFHINDKKSIKSNINLRTNFEIPTESEMGFKTVIIAFITTKIINALI